MSHTLTVIVEDGERYYEMEHPNECPTQSLGDCPLTGETVTVHTCLEEALMECASAYFGELPVGKHVIEGWHTPPGWAGSYPIDAEMGYELIEGKQT